MAVGEAEAEAAAAVGDTAFKSLAAKEINHCTETILPAITARESAQDMVLKMIKRRRDYFNSKHSYKKMNKADFMYS